MQNDVFETVEKKLNAAGETNGFFRILKDVYEQTESGLNSNKQKHFYIQKKILYGSAAVSCINIVASVAGNFSGLEFIVPVMTGCASIVSIFVTLYIGKRGTDKYCETWLRHQSHKAKMDFEMLAYAFALGEYKKNDEKTGAEMFIDNMVQIWKANQECFETNMSNYEVE